MKVERNEQEVILRLSSRISAEKLSALVRIAEILEQDEPTKEHFSLTDIELDPNKPEPTEEEILALANEVKRGMWERYKEEYGIED